MSANYSIQGVSRLVPASRCGRSLSRFGEAGWWALPGGGETRAPRVRGPGIQRFRDSTIGDLRIRDSGSARSDRELVSKPISRRDRRGRREEQVWRGLPVALARRRASKVNRRDSSLRSRRSLREPSAHAAMTNLGILAFMIQEPLLPPSAAAVAAESPVGANHAMAGHHNRDPILAVDAADRSDRCR